MFLTVWISGIYLKKPGIFLTGSASFPEQKRSGGLSVTTRGLTQIFSSLIDSEIYETYSWHYNHEKYLAVHGHQFDRFLINNALISDWASAIYIILSKGWIRKKGRSAII